MTKPMPSDVSLSVARYYDDYGWRKQSDAHGEDSTFRRFSASFRAYCDLGMQRVFAQVTARTDNVIFVGVGDLPDSHRALARRFDHVTCLDVSAVGLDLARGKLGDRAAYVVESIVDTSLPDDSFDFVYCAHVLYHIGKDEQEAAVRQMIRIVRPGGRIVIIYANPFSPFRLPGQLLDAAKLLAGRARGFSGRGAPTDLYYHTFGLGWWRRFEDACAVRLEPSEVVVGRFADTLLRLKVVETPFLAVARWLETRAPAVAARLWHFPMVILSKPDA